MRSLDLVDGWPCANVAAAHIAPGGTVDTTGDVDHVFALASVTKLFSSVACLIATEEGSVDLDEPTGSTGISLADLLAHSSGLGPDGTRLDDPGRRRVYSNAGYEQAAERVAEATGIDFRTYVHEAVFEPLEMTATSLDGSPAHGANSSVADLVRFVDGLDRLLSASTLTRMITPHLPEIIGVLPGYGRQTPNPWGLGPELRGDKSPHWTGARNSARTWGHFGQAGTFVWVDPTVDHTLIVLTDNPFGEWAKPLWPALADAVLAS